MSPELSFEIKEKQGSNRAVVSPTILYSIKWSVYNMRECMRTMSSANSCLWGPLASQHYSKFVANITSESMFQGRTKECKTRSFNCKAYLNHFCSLRHFNWIQFSLWLCLSWMRAFIASTTSLMEAYRPCFNSDDFESFSSKNINFHSVTFWYVDG